MHGFLLNLQGPMMSFGDTGFETMRQAGRFPSRSAVIGILAASLGIERGSRELLRLHEALRIHAATVSAGVPLVDYHTIAVKGYDEYDPDRLRRGNVPGANPVLTDRIYHTDAHFVVLVEGRDKTLVEECREALGNPVYTAFLGRRSCPPTMLLEPDELPEEYSIVDSLGHAVLKGRDERKSGRRKHRGDDLFSDSFDIYFDGMEKEADSIECSPPFKCSVIKSGYRRDLLTEVPRSYVNRPYTHVRVAVSDETTRTLDSGSNQEYFNHVP